MKQNQNEIIKKTSEFVKTKLLTEGSGHDWWHIVRVWNNAKQIGKTEEANRFVVELAALLHDIADWKLHDGNDKVGPQVAREWLGKIGVQPATINHVCSIIQTMAFKGAKVKDTPMETIEGKIVQDADRLDAVGAIGIARTFTFGGSKGRPIWNPDIKPVLHENSKDYLNSAKVGNTINHFYEKLLLLKDRMNTKTAKSIATERHNYMKEFLNKFFKEWEGYA